jgi:hypothetical protein
MKGRRYYLFGAFLCIVLAFAAGWLEKNGLAGMAFAGFAILLFVANIEHISRFKVLGSEVETREINSVIQEGKATIAEMKELAKLSMFSNLWLAQRAGRFGGFSNKEIIYEETIKTAKKLGFTLEEQIPIFYDWHACVMKDYVYWVLRKLNNEKIESILVRLRKMGLGDTDGMPTPEQLLDILSEQGLLTDEKREAIEDYRHYALSNEHRRPDVWSGRNNN